MKAPSLCLAALLVLPLALHAQEAEQAGSAEEMPAATADPIPVTAASAEALEHYRAGERALDMGRPDDARPHFEKAIAADPGFTLAYLGLANAANSLESFQSNLERAAEKAAGTTEAEQLRVEIAQKDFDNDHAGAEATAKRLAEANPNSARAWMALAGAQSDMNREAAARKSLEKAIAADPDWAAPHMALGNSYLFLEPRDLAKAEKHMAKAVELASDEPVPHDLLGDTYRAQGQLEKAAEEYTKVAELDPESGSGLQQRGHVHSFLGNYEQARADYTGAIELEKGKNLEPSFSVYRALVHVHEDKPREAIEELEEVVGGIDAMGVPEPRGQKIFALGNIFDIALHHEMFDVAESALERWTALMNEQAEQIGTESAERNTKAAIAAAEGQLAARKGNTEQATTKASEIMTILEPSTDPGKNEPAHAILGYVSLKQGDASEAVSHFEQADSNDIEVVYWHARALEEAGRTDEAASLYRKVANWNFNSADLALVRKDAASRIE